MWQRRSASAGRDTPERIATMALAVSSGSLNGIMHVASDLSRMDRFLKGGGGVAVRENGDSVGSAGHIRYICM